MPCTHSQPLHAKPRTHDCIAHPTHHKHPTRRRAPTSKRGEVTIHIVEAGEAGQNAYIHPHGQEVLANMRSPHRAHNAAAGRPTHNQGKRHHIIIIISLECESGAQNVLRRGQTSWTLHELREPSQPPSVWPGAAKPKSALARSSANSASRLSWQLHSIRERSPVGFNALRAHARVRSSTPHV